MCAAPTGCHCASWRGKRGCHTQRRRTTSPIGAACSPRWPLRGSSCWPWLLPRHGPEFLDAALAYVRFAIDHPGHYRVMFDKSLVDPSNRELVAAQAAAGAELSRGVASLPDRHAKADPAGAELAAWSLVHGFSMLWLNDAVNARLKATDPMATVERIARMLFEGRPVGGV